MCNAINVINNLALTHGLSNKLNKATLALIPIQNQQFILFQLSNLAKRIKMNYNRILTTYHEEIDPKGCFNQGMGAAAPAITANNRNRGEFKAN